MNNEINNKKVEIPTGIDMNDKDYLSTLLSLIKSIEKNLAISLTEASNEELYKEYKKMFDEISKFQRIVYELMYKFGWYQLEKANKTKISNLLKTLETEVNDLN